MTRYKGNHIHSLKAIVSLLITGALVLSCTDSKTNFVVQPRVEEFSGQSTLSKIDIILFLDKSPSMIGIWNDLDDRFAAFAQTYLDPQSDESLGDVRILSLRQDAFWGNETYKGTRKPGIDHFEVVLDTINPQTGQRRPLSEITNDFNEFVERESSRLDGHYISRYDQSIVQGLDRMIRRQKQDIRKDSYRLIISTNDADDFGSAKWKADGGVMDAILPMPLNFNYGCLHSITGMFTDRNGSFQATYDFFTIVCMKENTHVLPTTNNVLEYRKSSAEDAYEEITKRFLTIDNKFPHPLGAPLSSLSETEDPRIAIKSLAPYEVNTVAKLRKTGNCDPNNTYSFTDPATMGPAEPNLHTDFPVKIGQINDRFSVQQNLFSRFSSKEDVCESDLSQVFGSIGTELQTYGGEITLSKFIDLSREVTIEFINKNGSVFKSFKLSSEPGIIVNPLQANVILISVPLIRAHTPDRIRVLYHPDLSGGLSAGLIQLQNGSLSKQ